MADLRDLSPSALDLTDPWLRHRDPEGWDALFARLRTRDAPVFFPEAKFPFLPRGAGYHALVRHADVAAASRDAAVFGSAPCAVVPEIPAQAAAYVGSMLIDMDAPRHTRIRRVVSRAFSPRVLARIDDGVRLAAREQVDELVARGPGDFVEPLAARLPVRVIGDMMGIPREHHERLRLMVQTMIGLSDPELGGLPEGCGRARALSSFHRAMRASRSLYRFGIALGRERAAEPRDDLASVLVRRNDDGDRLSSRELGSFFVLLLVAGTETTGNALAHGLRLFTDHPGQRARLLSDLDGRVGGAVEEVVRLASPVLVMRRTLRRDHELRGTALRRGDRVMLFYRSANRDEAVFDRPEEFDITRSPNPHLGFGGPGPHHCLGAHLARRELAAAFTELFSRLPGIRATGRPGLLVSPFFHGVKSLGCDWRGRP
ncbi:cytochrome P450 [Spirillospora sp. CA-294931]|uniref:cytochrome P450 n=1 Tax=Spirillospora sp. CA-294931 TaxID=3240042 RepID=UPI003D925D0A